MLNHHDLNLGEGSPLLVGEMKGVSRFDTQILKRFSFKAKEATTAGKAKVERCPRMPWSKPSWQANL